MYETIGLFVVRGWVRDGHGLLQQGHGKEGGHLLRVRSAPPAAGPCHKPWRGPAGYPQALLWGLLWALSHVPCGAAGLLVGLGLCPVPGGLLCYYLNRDSNFISPAVGLQHPSYEYM